MIKTILKIDGMMCGMCESHINDCIRNNFSVKSVKSSHGSGETVIISDDALNESALKAAIDDTGYVLLSVSAQPYQKKGLLGFIKK